MNACAVSDHVIAHGLRPGSPFNVILPEQLISVKHTDEKMGPIRRLERARFGRITEVETAKAVVERQYRGNSLLEWITRIQQYANMLPSNDQIVSDMPLNPIDISSADSFFKHAT